MKVARKFAFKKKDAKFVVRSKAEMQVFRTLTSVLDKKEKIVIGCKPNWLVNPSTGNILELDFYLPKSKIAFEVQGPHHIYDHKQIYRDDVKKYLCEERDIKLFRIGILENEPNYFYKLFLKLNNEYGYKIKLREPSWKWGIRRSWSEKYNKSIKKYYGDKNPYYKNPDKFFDNVIPKSQRAYILKHGGKKEYI